MIVILEGVDCAGKSWMAERLAKALPNAYLLKHGNRPKQNTPEAGQQLMNSYKTMLRSYQAAGNDAIFIFDRFFMSEMIYGPITRGYCLLNDEDFKGLANIINEADHLYIEIVAEKEQIIKRMEMRGEYYLKVEKLDKVISGYQGLFDSNLILNKLQSKSGLESIERITELITGEPYGTEEED